MSSHRACYPTGNVTPPGISSHQARHPLGISSPQACHSTVYLIPLSACNSAESIEKDGFVTLVEKLLNSFLKWRNTGIIGKTDVGKRCNSKPLSHHENTEFKFPVKAHPSCDQFCTYYDQFQPEFIGSIDLLRGQSSSASLWRLTDLLRGQSSRPCISSSPTKFISKNPWKTPTPKSRLLSILTKRITHLWYLFSLQCFYPTPVHFISLLILV